MVPTPRQVHASLTSDGQWKAPHHEYRPSDRIRTILKAAVALAAVLAQAGIAHAEVLINPAGGTVLFGSETSWDDSVVLRPLGLTLDYFGAAKTSMYVSTNGNLNLNATAAFSNNPLPNGSSGMIAPLWDDLYIVAGTGQSIVEKNDPGTYYSVTWNVSQYSDPSQLYRFQAVLFGAPTTIGGFQFLANDIAFSYDLVPAAFRDGSATVGLNQGDGVGFAPTPGTTDGIVTDSNASLLPTAAGQFTLFRANGAGYDASIEPVPEIDPAGMGSVASLVLGALGLLERRRRTGA